MTLEEPADAPTPESTPRFTVQRRTFLQIVAGMAAAGAVASQSGLLPTSSSAFAAPQLGAPAGGAFLLDETFAFLVDFDSRQYAASGWEIRALGGHLTYAFESRFRIADAAGAPTVGMRKRFRAVSDSLVWEFRFQPVAGIDGAEFSLLDELGGAGIRLAGVSGALHYVTPTGSTPLASLANGTGCGVRVTADVAANTVNIDINGQRVVTGAPFSAAVTSLDTVDIATSGAADLYLGPIRVAVGYLLLEDFSSVLPGNAVGNWTTVGPVTPAIVSLASSQHADKYSLRLVSTGVASASTTFTGTTAASRFDLSFYGPVNVNGTVIELWLGNGRYLRLSVQTSKLYYRNSSGVDTQIGFINYATGIWHHLSVVLTGTKADIFLNSKQKANQVSLPAAAAGAPAGLTLTVASGATVAFDDIRITEAPTYPADYVPTPVPVSTGDYLVGVQSCSLWREGYHRGWDVINPYRERKPLLGYYDEGNPEVADWENKWLAENGVSFQIFCWYRPVDGMNSPIRIPRLGLHLHEGYLRSKYSDSVDFAILWENSGEPTNSADFRQHIVPYWLEYYFKDERYLTVDNKPVLSIYNLAALVTAFGSVAGVKAEMDYLRSVVVASGFAGLILLGVGIAATPAMGFDAEYAYSRKGYFGPQTTDIVARRVASAVDVLPTISIGRNDLAWNSLVGDYATPSTYEDLATWARDEFMPGAAAGALSRRMVILDNWNEYGEGHFIFPAELAGFGYLEAIRSTFGTAAGPANTTPTAAQVARVTTLYPADRVLPPVNETVPPKSAVFDAEWTFDTDGDLEGWSDLHGTITGLRVQDGALQGTATTNDPSLLTPNGLTLEAADHPYVRVKLTTSAPSAQEFFFITTAEPVYDRDKGMTFCADPVPGTDDEYDIEVWRMPKWRGTIPQFRIDPLTMAGSFAIESVRVMYVPSPSPRASLNGAVYPDLEIHTSGSAALVSGDFVFERRGIPAEFDSIAGVYSVLAGSDLVQATIGSTTATLNGSPFTLDAAPSLGSYGEVLLPLSFFVGGLGATASWSGGVLSLEVP